MCILLYYWANKMMISTELSAIIMVPRTASPSVGIERRPPTHLMYLCLEIMAGDDFHSVTYFLTWQSLFGSTNGTDLENDPCAGKSTLTLHRRHTNRFFYSSIRRISRDALYEQVTTVPQHHCHVHPNQSTVKNWKTQKVIGRFSWNSTNKYTMDHRRAD